MNNTTKGAVRCEKL